MQRASFCSLFVAKLFYQRFSAFSFPRVTYVSYLNTIVLKDGGSKDMAFDARKKMPPRSEETRRKQSEAMKARSTPERRQKMSECMKQLRKERGKNWRKT
jgi:Spy/CpxP family protein refolding chaperone